jgi:hypothetical protein
MPDIELPEHYQQDQITLFLLSVYPRGADPEMRRASFSELFPGKSDSTYDRYYRKSRIRLEEKGLIDEEENITPAGFVFLANTSSHFIIPQAITRVRELQDRCWTLENRNDELEGEVSELERHLSSAERRAVAYETHIVQLLQPRSDSEEVPNIPDSIREEVQTEIQRAVKCLDVGLHNSAVSTCGKILETVLHERYETHKGRPLPRKETLGRIIERFRKEKLDQSPEVLPTLVFVNRMRNLSLHKNEKAVSFTWIQGFVVFALTIAIIEKLFSKG